MMKIAQQCPLPDNCEICSGALSDVHAEYSDVVATYTCGSTLFWTSKGSTEGNTSVLTPCPETGYVRERREARQDAIEQIKQFTKTLSIDRTFRWDIERSLKFLWEEA